MSSETLKHGNAETLKSESPPRFTARAVDVVRDGADIVLKVKVDCGKQLEIALPEGKSAMITDLPGYKPARVRPSRNRKAAR